MTDKVDVEPGRPPFDLVIAGGTLIDGSGTPARRDDVGVLNGRIAAIGDLAAIDARRLDAHGRVVTPGFVDIHSHSDFTLLVDPTADSALAQGVTTEIVGNCGHGCAPIAAAPDARFTANIYGWGPDVRTIDWSTVGGYLDALGEAQPAINVGTLVPLGNLRLVHVDDVRRPADGATVRRLARALEQGLDDGALGLSSGLEYPAEHATSSEELDILCRTVAARNRLYATHTRDRGLGVVPGTAEAVETARSTGVRTQVSHILARHGSGGDDANARIATLLEDAAGEGLPIAWDVHTRLFGITNLSTALANKDDIDSLRVGRSDDTVIASFGRAGWERTFVLEAGDRFAELAATSVGELAARTGHSPRDILTDVLRDAAAQGDVNRPMAFATTYDESDIASAVRTSRCAVGSDATTMRLDSCLLPRMLPGAFTWAAWFLRRLVGEWRALPLEEAIRRITSLPADQAGLTDRGRLVVGARADIAVFDPVAVREPADPIRPTALATGVDHVLVNGAVAWTNGRATGERAGTVLRA